MELILQLIRKETLELVIICGAFEAGATYSFRCIHANNWTGGKVDFATTVSAKIIGNAAVGYTVGQTAELAAIGASAAVKSGCECHC